MMASKCRSVGTLPMIRLCSAMDDGDAAIDGTELQGMENTRLEHQNGRDKALEDLAARLTCFQACLHCQTRSGESNLISEAAFTCTHPLKHTEAPFL